MAVVVFSVKFVMFDTAAVSTVSACHLHLKCNKHTHF